MQNVKQMQEMQAIMLQQNETLQIHNAALMSHKRGLDGHRSVIEQIIKKISVVI